MMISIDYHEEADGYTHPSLRRLRNGLARRIDNHVMVYQVQTADIRCGFLIIDHVKQDAIWSGDGFRTDDGGEGGSGYRTALALMDIMNIGMEILTHEPVAIDGPGPLRELIEKEDLLNKQFAPKYTLSERYPTYVRR